MNKKIFPQYQKKVDAANKVLHDTQNEYARKLLGRVTTCADTSDAVNIHKDIESAKKDGTISDAEYLALTDLHNYIVADGNLVPTNPIPDASATDVFRKRIWSESDLSKVMQLRNCVTDMTMLGFIDINEYIELNNEIDRYIQYSLTNGGIK